MISKFSPCCVVFNETSCQFGYCLAKGKYPRVIFLFYLIKTQFFPMLGALVP
ncbi:hypothetical protein MAR_011683 [Mya arenaria]|uniref:Uncharacterized protein n=1 Tax=Mya arenaria TaxID=6604 RepID=A0ABY7FXG2_MYAAR|nr:hypothetical protein MAR_011683 [Mya arenaria]